LFTRNGGRARNAVEAEIIREVVAAAPTRHNADSMAVITPHRAQRALLRSTLFDEHGLGVSVIDNGSKAARGP
jgi:hypothetical protein